MVAEGNQNPDRAELLYEEGFDGLDQLDELNNRSVLSAYIVAGDRLCDRAVPALQMKPHSNCTSPLNSCGSPDQSRTWFPKKHTRSV
jgi:hypothetical protein